MPIINNKKECCYNICGLLIVPGLNKISEQNYRILLQHEAFVNLIEKNVFKEIKENNVDAVIKEEIEEIKRNKRNIEESVINKVKIELRPKEVLGDAREADVKKEKSDNKVSRKDKSEVEKELDNI